MAHPHLLCDLPKWSPFPASARSSIKGKIVLEELDFIVDPVARAVRPNPRSPDIPMMDMF